MTKCAERLASIMVMAIAAWPAAASVVLTGEVQSVDSQVIYTPQSNSSPVVLRYYVPEGTRVRKGDVVLRIDPGQSASQIRSLAAQVEQARVRAAKELAELQVKVVDAELALVDAEAALASAKIDAGVPKQLISGLDYDRRQGELDRARREAELKRAELATARAAVERRRQDSALEIRKLELQRQYHAARVGQAEVRADRDGTVLHGFNNNWIGGRIDEGSSTMPGSKAGEVVSGGAMRVRAWALEVDRRPLRVGQGVAVTFDALPGRRAAGRIATISGAPERKPEWGAGRYFQVDIVLPGPHGLALLPGMSARVHVGAQAPGGTAGSSTGRAAR